LLFYPDRFGQQSERYEGEYVRYHTAEDLFEKQKYSAAQQEFSLFMDELQDVHDAFFIKSKYYHALCALYLYHANAESLLLGFLAEYPESIYRMEIYLELARHYYRRKDYKKAIATGLHKLTHIISKRNKRLSIILS
jgi:TolA-binding protein